MDQPNAKASFTPLPRPRNATGDARRVGVEIEFAGLTEQEAADLAMGSLGGQIAHTESHSLQIEDTQLGGIEVVLDTALRKYGDNALVGAGLDAARGLVPVEIVTEPLAFDQLDQLDAFREELRAAGALGTDDGVLLGFGVHFNIEIVAADDPFTQATILSFGLLEDWLRHLMPIDVTRRLMPFVDPWPRDFLDALVAAGATPGFDEIRALYAQHCNSRNHGLDLLPIYEFADPDRFPDLFPGQSSTKGRPAFHYRLPDCRIDEETWSLAHEWRRWWLVEALASDAALLEELRGSYQPGINREEWAAQVSEHIGAKGEKLRG